MPTYSTTVPHQYGQREAMARLAAAAEAARNSAHLDGRWAENTFTFSARVQGLSIRGSVRVEDEAIHFDGHLPLYAMPFAGYIARALKVGLRTHGPAAATAPAASRPGAPVGAGAHPPDRGESGGESPVVLFLHIPKAGGLTFSDYICSQWCDHAERNQQLLERGIVFVTHGFFRDGDETLPEYLTPHLRRPDLRAVLGHFSFGIHERVSRPWSYVTLLRDPVARVVSLYRYLKLETQVSLEEFASSPPFKEVDNDQTRRIAGVDPAVGQCTTANLRTAQEHLREHFAVVGVTERLDETAVLLKRRLGWTKDAFAEAKNVNPVRPPAELLSPPALAAVRARNEFDLELYEFATRLLDEAVLAQGPGFRDDLARYRAARSGPPKASGGAALPGPAARGAPAAHSQTTA